MAALTREMNDRHVPRDNPSKPDGLGSKPQDVSSILHSLIKERGLRTNIPKLSIFSGERVKGEASFEQWSYELQSLRRTYSESALREGIQRSMRGAAVDTVHSMALRQPLIPLLKNSLSFMEMSNPMTSWWGISSVPIRERRKQSPHLLHI